MNLAELIKELIEVDGLSPRDAAKVAAATMKASGATSSAENTTLTNRSHNSSLSATSSQEEADEWKREQRNDPNGIYNISNFGIFGSGNVAFEDYDPGAEDRNLRTVHTLSQIKTSEQLGRLVDLLSQERGAKPQPKRLDPPNEEPRRLGRKRDK